MTTSQDEVSVRFSELVTDKVSRNQIFVRVRASSQESENDKGLTYVVTVAGSGKELEFSKLTFIDQVRISKRAKEVMLTLIAPST